ncbi:MAG: hypothetical protein OXC11_16250 [Rhodospirillales bacterium]|nr:hypothetical protein [Rhodospirillales bacterium]
MDKRPFLAGVQQELYFLPSALKALEAGQGRRPAIELVEAEIEKRGLDEEHLEGLGLFGADREDEDGEPAVPPWDAVLPAMAIDCLDELRQLNLIDEDDRLTRDGLECLKDIGPLQRAVRNHYKVEGADRVKRPVAGQLTDVFVALTMLGKEQEDDPFSVIYRPALCMAEFMRLHFWMQELERRPGTRRFARILLEERRQDLVGKDVEGDSLEWAALCVALGAAKRLEDRYGVEARLKVAAVKSTALMLCHAGLLTFDGFPSELQWLRHADRRAFDRRLRQLTEAGS